MVPGIDKANSASGGLGKVKTPSGDVKTEIIPGLAQPAEPTPQSDGIPDAITIDKLSPDNIKSFKPYLFHKPCKHTISSIDFTHDGEKAIVSDHNSVKIYKCLEVEDCKVVRCEKYGVGCVQFMHNSKHIVHSSRQKGHDIRQLHTDKEAYLRYYVGHKDFVSSISISPRDERLFLSADIDYRVFLWDSRTGNHVASIERTAAGTPYVTYDPIGVIAAVLDSDGSIDLYDVRKIETGKNFQTFSLDTDCQEENKWKGSDDKWKGLQFSPSGRGILLTTNSSCQCLLDAFTGKLMHRFQGYENSEKVPIRASFSPDNGYLFCGSHDKLVHIWDVESGKKELTLDGTDHLSCIRAVQFHPRRAVFASACKRLIFWQCE